MFTYYDTESDRYSDHTCVISYYIITWDVPEVGFLPLSISAGTGTDGDMTTSIPFSVQSSSHACLYI